MKYATMHCQLSSVEVYHTGRPPYLFAARSPWCSASRGLVSDSWSLPILD